MIEDTMFDNDCYAVFLEKEHEKGEAMDDTISRQAAIEMCREPRMRNADCSDFEMEIMMLPSAEPKRKWIPCSNPPKHHKDVIVRGIEAIGNVTVYKVMQWDVDMWRPSDYAPSIVWKEWSEI